VSYSGTLPFYAKTFRHSSLRWEKMAAIFLR
jgi:hypothetical protein